MAAKRYMDIKRNVLRHRLIIANITGYAVGKRCVFIMHRDYAGVWWVLIK